MDKKGNPEKIQNTKPKPLFEFTLGGYFMLLKPI